MAIKQIELSTAQFEEATDQDHKPKTHLTSKRDVFSVATLPQEALQTLGLTGTESNLFYTSMDQGAPKAKGSTTIGIGTWSEITQVLDPVRTDAYDTLRGQNPDQERRNKPEQPSPSAQSEQHRQATKQDESLAEKHAKRVLKQAEDKEKNQSDERQKLGVADLIAGMALGAKSGLGYLREKNKQREPVWDTVSRVGEKRRDANEKTINRSMNLARHHSQEMRDSLSRIDNHLKHEGYFAVEDKGMQQEIKERFFRSPEGDEALKDVRMHQEAFLDNAKSFLKKSKKAAISPDGKGQSLRNEVDKLSSSVDKSPANDMLKNEEMLKTIKQISEMLSRMFARFKAAFVHKKASAEEDTATTAPQP